MTIELTKSEMAAVYMAIISQNKLMNNEINELDKKIDSANFDKAMKLIIKRDALKEQRKLLFSTIDKFSDR